jgi:hypothetical protein
LKEKILDKAIRYSLFELDKTEGDFDKLSVELQTVILVQSAQAIIDNGGFEYFFEADFPNFPNYYLFVEAYKRINSTNAANILVKAINMFPFNEPHLYKDKRNKFMKLNAYSNNKEFTKLGNIVCGDQTVWSNLENYIINHKVLFGFK